MQLLITSRTVVPLINVKRRRLRIIHKAVVRPFIPKDSVTLDVEIQKLATPKYPSVKKDILFWTSCTDVSLNSVFFFGFYLSHNFDTVSYTITTESQGVTRTQVVFQDHSNCLKVEFSDGTVRRVPSQNVSSNLCTFLLGLNVHTPSFSPVTGTSNVGCLRPIVSHLSF